MKLKYFLFAARYSFAFLILISPFQLIYSAERHISSQQCHHIYDNSSDFFSCPPVGCGSRWGNWVRYEGKVEIKSGPARTVICPFVSDSHLSHANVDTLLFYSSSVDQGSFSRACVKHYDNAGSACGVSSSWGVNPVYFIGGLDVSEWNAYPASFPFILNVMGEGSALSGFYLSD